MNKDIGTNTNNKDSMNKDTDTNVNSKDNMNKDIDTNANSKGNKAMDNTGKDSTDIQGKEKQLTNHILPKAVNNHMKVLEDPVTEVTSIFVLEAETII